MFLSISVSSVNFKKFDNMVLAIKQQTLSVRYTLLCKIKKNQRNKGTIQEKSTQKQRKITEITDIVGKNMQ